MSKHPMIQDLQNLRGNPKACVLTEPLWGIPHSLYVPFVSVYMLALGLTDVQIGLIASLTLLIRACTAVISGTVTDKLGRKRTTIIFDILSWSVPCLMWAVAQNVWWFYIAALFNGLWQMTENSWTCLLVEDAEKSKMVNIYSWIYVAGQLSVFFAPLSGLLVGKL
ncbi:MFS transporter, partial [Eubacteriales bacterium OttesenSCG-928-A19]|nr:MFS transporter [Eubacteriales bacterium OttesenSCG-928-A19]